MSSKWNWYIHVNFIKKNYEECSRVIEEQLLQSNRLSEYPLYIRGLIHRLEGDVAKSLTLFQAVLNLDPLNGNAIKQIGKSFYLLGKHHDALEALATAENTCREDRTIFHDKGICYTHLKQYEKAIEMFKIANMIQRNLSTFLQLGRVQRLMGKDDDALITYMDALDLESDNSEILCIVGLLYLKLHNNAKAFEYLGNSLTYDARNTKSILAAGSIIQDNQDVDVALNKYRIAVIETPNSAQLWNNVGMCLFGKRKTVAAVACLKKAIFLSPFEWIINFNLGILNLSTGQYASAFHFLSTSINLNPSYARSYMYLAVTLSRLEDFDNSCSAYEKALELGGEDFLTYLNYAITSYLNDEVEAARNHFNSYVTLFTKARVTLPEVDSSIVENADILERLLNN